MPTKRSAAAAVHISTIAIGEALGTYIFGTLIDEQLKNQRASLGKSKLCGTMLLSILVSQRLIQHPTVPPH